MSVDTADHIYRIARSLADAAEQYYCYHRAKKAHYG